MSEPSTLPTSDPTGALTPEQVASVVIISQAVAEEVMAGDTPPASHFTDEDRDTMWPDILAAFAAIKSHAAAYDITITQDMPQDWRDLETAPAMLAPAHSL